MNVNSTLNNVLNAHSNNVPRAVQQKAQQATTTLAADNFDKFDSKSINVNRNFQNAPNAAENLNIHDFKRMNRAQQSNMIVTEYANFQIRQQAGNNFWNELLGAVFNPSSFAVDAFNAAEATSAKHEDYWGVDAVAERIFTFARTLAGTDNIRADNLFSTMRNAFLKGFNLASNASGGALPDISVQTKDKVLELFGEWEDDIYARNNPNPEPEAPEDYQNLAEA